MHRIFRVIIGPMQWQWVVEKCKRVNCIHCHHWTNAVAMATPIAHKGVTAGAKVEALTILDLLLDPRILKDAWAYFNEEQTKVVKYTPIMAETDMPAIFLNKQPMDIYRPTLEKFYYEPSKYATYLEQLGVSYPTLEK